MYRVVCLYKKYICIFLLSLSVIPLFSQGSEKVFEGKESLLSDIAIRKVTPLFLGAGFEYLYPLAIKTIFSNSSTGDNSVSVISQSTPFSLDSFAFVLNPSFIMGTEFPYIFGVAIPLSMDIYAKIGTSFVNAGSKDSNSNEYFGYRAFDINGDVNVRFIFVLHQYANFGMYITSGIGVAYPIFRGYGYFKDSTQFFLSKSDYSNIINDSDERLTNASYYTSISAGIVMDKISSYDIKFVFGYAVRFFLSNEINDIKQITFGDRGEITSIGVKDYSIQHGVQLEGVYSLD